MPSKQARTLAAIMFTDMVGYTALMQKDEILARRKRDRHRSVLKELHEKYDGQIIQYFGDGTLSIFDSSVDAVQCAIEIQQELQEPIEVPLRIGVHSGDIVVEADNILGDAVNLASRIESFSVPGAVLISDVVYGQIKNQPQFQLQSLGKFQLKNVDRPFEIFALANEGLIAPDPAELAGKGRRLDATKHNLPQQPTSFIGREQEIEEIGTLIQKKRLVTLTGPGGTGKTRLALKVAESLIEDFKDGLFWIPLAATSKPDSVSLAMIKALDLIQIPSKSGLDLLIEFLREKEILLILDNFEQVLEAASIVQALLQSCSSLKILVTSRIVLHLQMEQEYPLRPLPTPILNGNNQVERLMGFPSMNLFYQRAKAVKPKFDVNERNALAVADICRRLDGLPLALELAAARIKIFSPRALLSRLDRHLDLLKTENPDRPERHHTLRQTISWSYQLLPEKERRLFNRLAVFSGGCYLEAVESVCGQNGLDSFEIVDQVFALGNKSLISREEDSEGEIRFYLLETIRAFALEKLSEQEDLESLREAHARYFVARSEEAHPHLTGSDQARWLSLLEEDLNNFREAFNWTIKKGRYDLAFRLGIVLWRLWTARGMFKEGVSNAQRLLDCEVDENLKPFRAKIVTALVSTYFHMGDFATALSLCQENVLYWRQMGDQREIAKNLNHLGFALVRLSQTEVGVRYTNEALDMYRKLHDLRGQAVSYNNFGFGYMDAGEPKKAALNFEQSRKLRRQIQDERGVGIALINLSRAQTKLGLFIEAESNFIKGLDLLKKDEAIYLWGLAHFGIMYYQKNEIEKCAQLLQDHKNRISNLDAIIWVQGFFKILEGFVAEYHGRYEKTRRLMQEVVQCFLEGESPIIMATGWYYRSKMAYNFGNWNAARDYMRSGLEINYKYNILLGCAENLELAGMICASTNELEKAALLLSHSRQMRSELETPVPPVLEADVADAWKRLRERLAPEKLEELIQKGKRMSREEIVGLI